MRFIVFCLALTVLQFGIADAYANSAMDCAWSFRDLNIQNGRSRFFDAFPLQALDGYEYWVSLLRLAPEDKLTEFDRKILKHLLGQLKQRAQLLPINTMFPSNPVETRAFKLRLQSWLSTMSEARRFEYKWSNIMGFETAANFGNDNIFHLLPREVQITILSNAKKRFDDGSIVEMFQNAIKMAANTSLAFDDEPSAETKMKQNRANLKALRTNLERLIGKQQASKLAPALEEFPSILPENNGLLDPNVFNAVKRANILRKRFGAQPFSREQYFEAMSNHVEIFP
jgi:hypothetical protein